MTFEAITDHVDQAQARQVKRWKGLPNEDSIIKIRVNRIQILEDVLNQMINERAISNSEGVQLDGLGEFYGEQGERSNRSDAEYRAFLQTLPAKLRQAGQIDVLIEALNALSGHTSTLLQSFPRVVLMHVYADGFNDIGDQALIRSSMEAIKAAGVKLEIGVQLNSSAFIFSDKVTGGEIGDGFATTTDQNDGGVFVRLLEDLEQFIILSESEFVILSEDGYSILSDTGL